MSQRVVYVPHILHRWHICHTTLKRKKRRGGREERHSLRWTVWMNGSHSPLPSGLLPPSAIALTRDGGVDYCTSWYKELVGLPVVWRAAFRKGYVRGFRRVPSSALGTPGQRGAQTSAPSWPAPCSSPARHRKPAIASYQSHWQGEKRGQTPRIGLRQSSVISKEGSEIP